jgi:hypothetical protein
MRADHRGCPRPAGVQAGPEDRHQGASSRTRRRSPRGPAARKEPDAEPKNLLPDWPEAMLIYSMGVSLAGFIADREGGFAWSAPDQEVFCSTPNG